MTRERLAAVIWEQLTRKDVYDPADAVAEILAAADDYAARMAEAIARPVVSLPRRPPGFPRPAERRAR